MNEHVVIVGGGVAGLTAGCYARASGFRTTLVEHHERLGGVCQAWQRGPYTIDGCIRWLCGGPFEQLYRELGIVPAVELRPLDELVRYKNRGLAFELSVSRDLRAFFDALERVAPADADELSRLRQAAPEVAQMAPPIEAPPELQGVFTGLARLWESRSHFATFVRYKKPLGPWLDEHITSAVARRALGALLPAEVPALLLLFVLGYLERGWLSRPRGGSGAFRDALCERYQRLGGEARLGATVEEIVVDRDRAVGVRLADGSLLPADVVVSTSSQPETVLRLLGGTYGGAETRERLARWKLFEPITLVSFGVARPLPSKPTRWILDDLPPFDVGGRMCERLSVQVFDEPAFAPAGHAVVQASLPAVYDWWAQRGAGYLEAKHELAGRVLDRLEPYLPGLRAHLRMMDVATPLTFWNLARSWRGAYEGWLPCGESPLVQLKKKLPDLDGFYMAGQWVEPGGGIPLSVMSGRHVIQLVCRDRGRPFATPPERSARAVAEQRALAL